MSLTIIILLIIFVPAIPFFCLLKKRKWKFWLDESSLHVQPLFWFLVFLPLIISGIAWVLVAHDYELDVSTNGYSRLMENAKFPFLILALSPILGAFVTSAHRSLQTELQIKTAKEQLDEAKNKNKIDILYSSRKDTYELIDYVKSINGEKIRNKGSLLLKAINIKKYTRENNENFIKSINQFIAVLDVELDKGKNIIEYDYDLSNELTKGVFHSFKIYEIEKKINNIKYFFCFEIENESFVSEKYNNLKEKLRAQDKKIINNKSEHEKEIENEIRNLIISEFNIYITRQLFDIISIIYEISSALYMNDGVDILFPELQRVINKANNLNLLALDL
ncbi:hypothetical protein LL668_16250 [Providencia rettgeri]|uniref:hypothetical protein n=1 Tax=Providencia rettgeri TaxID=587 RepID=UPI001E43FF4E|nr:hypothetical protein [Providencia rettgeri]UEK58825.1 hypothetical protein LL668_16250 [Providencia rettgeri]